jgi:hypothetical protein
MSSLILEGSMINFWVIFDDKKQERKKNKIIIIWNKGIQLNLIFCYCKFLVREVKHWDTLTSGGHLHDDVNGLPIDYFIFNKISAKKVLRFHILASKIIFNVIFGKKSFKFIFVIFNLFTINLPKFQTVRIVNIKWFKFITFSIKDKRLDMRNFDIIIVDFIVSESKIVSILTEKELFNPLPRSKQFKEKYMLNIFL